MTLLRSLLSRPTGSTLGHCAPLRGRAAALGGALVLVLVHACSSEDSGANESDSGSQRDAHLASDAFRADASLDGAADGGKADREDESSSANDTGADRAASGDVGAFAEAGLDAVATRSDSGGASPESGTDATVADVRDGGASQDGGEARDASPPFDASDGFAPAPDATADADVRAAEASSDGAAADVTPAPAPRYLVVVAHPDDDILFFNPDIASAIRAGVTVRTLYMTSGDSMMQDWAAREAGVLAATASIAGVPSAWTCQARTLGGHQLQACTLPGAPRVSAMFMRILDTSLGPLWQLAPGQPFPMVNPAPSVTTKDGASTYTRAQLTQMLADVVHDFLPTRLMLMDSTLAYDSDFEHHDHVASGMFGLAAAQADGTIGAIGIYRNYSMFQTVGPQPSTPANLTDAQYQEKVALMAIYGVAVNVNNPNDAYNAWCHRQYVISSVTLPAGPLRQPGGACLDVDGAAASGAAVVLAACSGTPAQSWTVRSDARVVGASGLCLTVGANGSSVVLGTCAGTAPQRWTLFDNGQLRGVEGSCLTASGTAVTVATCDHQGVPLGVAASQMWTR